MNTYIAHTKDDGNTQAISEHSLNTAQLARSFAISPFKSVAYKIGLLHDIGKYQETFQRRIRGENTAVEHSICGAQEAVRMFKKPVSLFAAYCIAGHHSGLPDGGAKTDAPDKSTLRGRLKRESGDFSA